MRRFVSFLALTILLVVPLGGRSADKDAPAKAAPTMVVRVRSIDGLIADALFLAELAGKGEEAKQADLFLQTNITDEGLKGIDTKRPIGLYSILSADVIGSNNVLLVPIASEKAFLDLLELLNQKVKKDKDDIYTVSPEQLPVSIHFRFAHKYLYVTAPEKSALRKDHLLEPAQVLPAQETGLLTALVDFEQIPKELKQIFLAQYDLQIAEELNKKIPQETETRKAARVQAIKDLSRQVAVLVQEGGRLETRLNLDRQAKMLTGELLLSGQPKSSLSVDLAELGKRQSLVAGLKRKEAAVNLLLHLTLPAELRKALGPVIEESIQQSLVKEKDEAKRAAADKFLTTLKPSLKAGELDLGFTVLGPSKNQHYSFVAGAKLVQGTGIEESLRELIKLLPERERVLVQFDADKAGQVNIHRIDAQKTFDADARRTFGNHPLFLAFRADSVWLAGGPDGLRSLKEALASQPTAAPLFHLDLALTQLAPSMGRGDDARTKAISQAVADIFKGNDDRIVFAVAGGTSLKASFSTPTAVIQFLARVGELDKKKKGKGQ